MVLNCSDSTFSRFSYLACSMTLFLIMLLSTESAFLTSSNLAPLNFLAPIWLRSSFSFTEAATHYIYLRENIQSRQCIKCYIFNGGSASSRNMCEIMLIIIYKSTRITTSNYHALRRNRTHFMHKRFYQ